MYQKHDYELFAGIIRGVSNDNKAVGASNGDFYVLRGALVKSLADAFEADNPMFDRSKFFLAAGEAYDLGRLEASE